MAKTPPKEPMRAGRFSRGQISAMMERQEPKMPAAPTPANARPKMRTFMVGATPQISEPTSKITMAASGGKGKI
jgi:hypothetical protein